MVKRIVFFLSLLLLSGQIVTAQKMTIIKEDFTVTERHYLVELFVGEEFDRGFLTRIFHHPELHKIPIVVKKNVINEEPIDHYKNFYSRYSIYVARKFLKRWRTVLKKADQKFDVDRNMLVAILLVETGLGTIDGTYPVISIFSSIIVEQVKENRKIVFSGVGEEDVEYRRMRLKKKEKWSRQEMKALLSILKSSGRDPFVMIGSYAGAFGIPQFLPSSYVQWGFDSDGNGTVNLDLFPDAIYSVANYLKGHGWKRGLTLKQQKEVLWQYNPSQIYVETLLKVARKLKKTRRRKPAASPKKKTTQGSKTPSIK